MVFLAISQPKLLAETSNNLYTKSNIYSSTCFHPLSLVGAVRICRLKRQQVTGHRQEWKAAAQRSQ
jgi:hypothetical protein